MERIILITTMPIFHKISDVCPWWLTYTFDNPLRRLVQNPQKIFGPYVKENFVVADIGCGMGYNSLGLAKLVGVDGKVISADIQQQQLNTLKRRAKRAGLNKRIESHLIKPDDIGISEKVDFALAFWVIHEVPDQKRLLGQIHSILKPTGNFLIAEPRIHVKEKAFAQTLSDCEEIGFKVKDNPKIFFSRAVLLSK